MDASVTTMLWSFVRGDLPVEPFEAWVSAQNDLERDLGQGLYWEVVSFDYRNSGDLLVLREKIADYLRPDLKCQCLALPDMAAVPMGSDGYDERVFASIDQTCEYGSDRWWLDLRHCKSCGQDWMVAQEERIYDVYLLKRLSPPDAQEIIRARNWPDDFSIYEKVLKLASRTGLVVFLDKVSDSLIESARDLKRDRPNISIEEIGELLGVRLRQAQALLRKI